MRKLYFSILTILLFVSCSNNSPNEKRVIVIVDSVINSRSNNLNTTTSSENKTTIDPFLGTWSDNGEDGNKETVKINDDNTMTISNSVCEMSLKYELVENELQMKYNGTYCKFQFGETNKIGKKVGKCFFNNNKLIVEFTSLNDSGTGLLNGTYKMDKVD